MPIDLPPLKFYLPPQSAVIRKAESDLAILPGIVPVNVGNALILDWIGQLGSTTSGLTTIAFGNLTFPNDALAIVAFFGLGTNSQTCNSISIGGINGALHAANGSASTRKWGLASRLVSAGSVAISVTLSGSNGSSASLSVGAWALRRTVSNTPVGSAGIDSGSGTTRTINHNQSSPGIAVYGAFNGESTGGAGSLSTAQTVHYAAQDGNGRRFTYASSKNVPTQTPHSETFTISASDNASLVGGSWR